MLCGQHNIGQYWFSRNVRFRTKSFKLVAPALQVLLGGGNLGDGNGAFCPDKVIKVPSKKALKH